MDVEKTSWLARVEELISVLEGSTISELELTEAGTELVIRRNPGMVMVSSTPVVSGVNVMQNGLGSAVVQSPVASAPPAKVDKSVGIAAPLTGVYYESASPTTPPFVVMGDVVRVGQVVALIEAMKVFNEIQADVSGRVVAMTATSGDVVQKGEVLLRIEPL
jgi:acetyl-CoA carboxylase biotin carboxyl carrier protein